jgi:hypothetical protein
MSNQVFEIVQAMSGQGNCVTIPGPYLDFFAGDRQQHLLAAILNQLVFWSGKSSLENGWFYKEHAAIAREVRAKDGDVARKAIYKIIELYLPGVIEEDTRKVNGTPKKHYRIDESALIAKIFPPLLDSAHKPNGSGSQAESKRLSSRMEMAHGPIPGSGSQAESYLYTDLKNRSLHTDVKTTREKNLPVDNSHGEAPKKGSSAAEKTELATDEDFEISRWFWSLILGLYEQAAEYDGTLARPSEPNWVGWANEVRLLREGHGCDHAQIRNMIERIQRDPWWCPKIQEMRTLRNKWPELVLKLCSGNLASGSVSPESFDEVDYSAGDLSGFRVVGGKN